METLETTPETTTRRHHRSGKPVVFGGIILLIGFALLLRIPNLIGLKPWGFFFSWELLMVPIATLNLFDKNKGFGLVMILVGSFFLVNNHFDLPFNLSQIFWPLILILAGVFLLLGANRFRNFRGQKVTGQQDTYNSIDEYFDDVAIFGGIERTVRSDNFRGGKIVAIFGGSKVNLNHVTLSPGPNVLEMVCIFGGSTLMVPADWNVKLEVISIFGGMGDKRPPMPVDMNKTLIIKGVVLFGGGELKSY